jgi:hypothetical protein
MMSPAEMQMTVVYNGELRCIICNELDDRCDCWTHCQCGWFHEHDKECPNPQCVAGYESQTC